MSEQPEAIKLKRITIKTESGSRWFDSSHKSMTWQLLAPVHLCSSLKNSWLETLHALCNQNFQAERSNLQTLLGLLKLTLIKTTKRYSSLKSLWRRGKIFT